MIPGCSFGLVEASKHLGFRRTSWTRAVLLCIIARFIGACTSPALSTQLLGFARQRIIQTVRQSRVSAGNQLGGGPARIVRIHQFGTTSTHLFTTFVAADILFRSWECLTATPSRVLRVEPDLSKLLQLSFSLRFSFSSCRLQLQLCLRRLHTRSLKIIMHCCVDTSTIYHVPIRASRPHAGPALRGCLLTAGCGCLQLLQRSGIRLTPLLQRLPGQQKPQP